MFAQPAGSSRPASFPVERAVPCHGAMVAEKQPDMRDAARGAKRTGPPGAVEFLCALPVELEDLCA
jgi:hypothetical protein